MEFRVLGPLEVAKQGRPLPIGAGKQRALLAALLLHVNEVVSTERLIDMLWGEKPPASATKLVQGYVSQLRKVLAAEPGDEDRADGEALLLTRPPGYVLRVEPGQVDSDRFTSLLGMAKATLAAGAPHDASLLLREAFGLWRGPPLADFTYEPFAREEIVRLEELRVVALEERIEADLALGRAADLVAELEALTARHPFRERLRGQLMLALYRCGRQAEALQAYQEIRRLLVAELGLEPSRMLQELEQAILRQDPTLEAPLSAEASSYEGAASLERLAEGEGARMEHPPPVQSPGSFFVGRERELAALLAALEDAFSGHGRLILIAGEPGIGKSRLADELARWSVERGARVLRGRCWEAGGAPAYWPWAQAIRSHVRDRSPDQLRADLGTGAAVIAEVIEDVRQRLPDLEQPPISTDPQDARFRFFDSIASFLKNAAEARPLMLVLDDLHWADKGSLLLLEFLVRELGDARLLLVGAYREIELSRGHPLADTLGSLARERLFERILLRGLAEDDVGRFIEVACGLPPPEELVRFVHAQTEGNPLFIAEIVRWLAQEGEVTPERLSTATRSSVRIPESVREVIRLRLVSLSERCYEILTIASVIGREFALDVLEVLIDDLSGDRLLELLEEALAAGVIEELPGAVGRFQFTHTLIRETLADELSHTRRARMHARIGEALEALYGADSEGHAAELAHHFAEAEAVLGKEKLVRYSLLAGEAALSGHAHEEALAHFERGLAAKERLATDDETAALLFGLGRAQLATLETHELEQAVASLQRAFDYYAAAGDADRAVAIAAHPLPLSVGIAQTGIPQLIERALTLVPVDSHEAGRLLSTHGWFVGVTEADYEGAHAAFARALAIAKRQGDSALETTTLANASFVDAFHLLWQDCLERGLRAIDLALRVGDLHSEMSARRPVAWALTAKGEREQAHLHATAALTHAEKLRQRWWLASASFNRQLVCLYEGDWRAAREMNELGLRALPRDPRHLALRALLDFEVGDFRQGAARIEQLQQQAMRSVPPGHVWEHVFMATVTPLVGRIAAADKHFELAETTAETVLSLPHVVPLMAMMARTGLALIAVQRGDAQTAEALYAALEPQRGTAMPIMPMALDRLLGLLAATVDRRDVALAHFEDALAFCGRAGYRPEYAWTACDYADVLLERAGPDDRPRAVTLHDEALTAARDLGMHPLTERVLARREIPKA